MKFTNNNFVGGKAFMLVSNKEVARIRAELRVKPRAPQKKAKPQPKAKPRMRIPKNVQIQRVQYLNDQGKSAAQIAAMTKFTEQEIKVLLR